MSAGAFLKIFINVRSTEQRSCFGVRQKSWKNPAEICSVLLDDKKRECYSNFVKKTGCALSEQW